MKIAYMHLPTFAICAVTFAAAQPTHHTSTASHRRAVPPCPAAAPAPALPAGIPPAPGKPETAFALRYIDIKPGDGPEAQAGQIYTVHYTGWLASDGTKFDSSLDRGEPISFPQGRRGVIPGWDLGFGGMHVGGKRRLFIPYQLAYGERGHPPVIPAKSDLIFDVELVSVSDAASPFPMQAPPPSQPKDPAQPAQPTQPSQPAQPATPPQPK